MWPRPDLPLSIVLSTNMPFTLVHIARQIKTVLNCIGIGSRAGQTCAPNRELRPVVTQSSKNASLKIKRSSATYPWARKEEAGALSYLLRAENEPGFVSREGQGMSHALSALNKSVSESCSFEIEKRLCIMSCNV